MKNIITILIISFLASSFTFQNEHNQYHVMALSGLKMRDLPSLQGKKVLTIPYNGKVQIINDGNEYDELKIQEFEDFNITGNWVKVRYQETEGFVFDGYLTPMELPSLEDENKPTDADKQLEYYFKTKFYQTGDKYNIIKFSDEWCNKEERDCKCGYSMDFASRIRYYSYSKCDEEGVDITAEIENISMQQAFYLMKSLDLNQTRLNKKKEKYNFRKGLGIIEVYPDDAGAHYSIKQRRRNTVEINILCSH
jgi:hypothetical protein